LHGMTISHSQTLRRVKSCPFSRPIASRSDSWRCTGWGPIRRLGSEPASLTPDDRERVLGMLSG
jgi:hypothetical protein